MSIRDTFPYLFTNYTGQHILPLLSFPTFQSPDFVENLEKKFIKTLQIEKKIGIFAIFSVKLFHSENWNYLVIKDSLITIF